MPIELLPAVAVKKPAQIGVVPVNFGRRALAYLIDLAFLYALTMATSLFFVFAYSFIHFGSNPAMPTVVAANASAFIKATHILYYFSYFTITHWFFGRTLGKWAMGLRLKRQQGIELSFARALGRSLLYVVSGQITLGVGFLLPLFRKDGRTLHDLIAGTEVVGANAEPAESAVSKAA